MKVLMLEVKTYLTILLLDSKLVPILAGVRASSRRAKAAGSVRFAVRAHAREPVNAHMSGTTDGCFSLSPSKINK